MAFTHNSTLADGAPRWSALDKTKLPRLAFADHGEADKKSTWRYPHHWVKGGGGLDDDGVFTAGTMYLHEIGVDSAWAVARGARVGRRAPPAVISHLQVHRRALGKSDDSWSFMMEEFGKDEWEALSAQVPPEDWIEDDAK